MHFVLIDHFKFCPALGVSFPFFAQFDPIGNPFRDLFFRDGKNSAIITNKYTRIPLSFLVFIKIGHKQSPYINLKVISYFKEGFN